MFVFKLTPCFSPDNPRQTTRVPVFIKVLDVNDNAPEFAMSYDTFVCENVKAGQVLGKILRRGVCCVNVVTSPACTVIQRKRQSDHKLTRGQLSLKARRQSRGNLSTSKLVFVCQAIFFFLIINGLFLIKTIWGAGKTCEVAVPEEPSCLVRPFKSSVGQRAKQ